ncbi:MAG TPA: cyclodeaminase/cyclohydrolase family protein [Thermodesulfobacteriota bacterium]|nr:cyclodeaminase/cyclohydrolase family protein [Thermodesulfobacteriota bacterium]
MELKRFLEKLSSDTPTPGGGSASALAGALSASLVSMVAGLTSKKDKIKKKGMEEIRKKGVSIQKRLFQAIEEDSKSYEAVLKAFRLPRNSEKERLRRIKEIQRAYRRATLTPQLVCQQSLQLLEYSRMLILTGNPNAVSDAGVAAFLADAACAGGLLNIRINLAGVAERSFVKKMDILMRSLGRERNRRMKAIQKSLIGTYHV